MSCYEWERGTFKLPVKEYKRVRDALLAFAKTNGDNVVDCKESKTIEVKDEECTIHCSDSTHNIAWDVPENNHARETAAEQPMAMEFFRLLRSVQWTKGTGGKIVANDEYNRDSNEDGGGGNYVVQAYGDAAKGTFVRG